MKRWVAAAVALLLVLILAGVLIAASPKHHRPCSRRWPSAECQQRRDNR